MLVDGKGDFSLSSHCAYIMLCVVGGGGGGGGCVALSCAEPLENTVRTNFEQKKVQIDWGNYVTRLLFWATPRGQIFTRRTRRGERLYAQTTNIQKKLTLYTSYRFTR
jgi:hypothetical protein